MGIRFGKARKKQKEIEKDQDAGEDADQPPPAWMGKQRLRDEWLLSLALF